MFFVLTDEKMDLDQEWTQQKINGGSSLAGEELVLVGVGHRVVKNFPYNPLLKTEC
jgi:hypothetical protein